MDSGMNPNGVSWGVAYEGMTCTDYETHVLGCPCKAGGDVELLPEYIGLPMCVVCGENPGSLGVYAAVEGDVEAFAGICPDCFEECE